MAAITKIRKKIKNLDCSGFQTMTLSCDKNGSMLVKEKKIMLNQGIHQGKMHWRKLRNLRKKGNHAKFKYYIGINVQVFDCLFDYLQAEKDIEAAKKN